MNLICFTQPATLEGRMIGRVCHDVALRCSSTSTFAQSSWQPVDTPIEISSQQLLAGRPFVQPDNRSRRLKYVTVDS